MVYNIMLIVVFNPQKNIEKDNKGE